MGVFHDGTGSATDEFASLVEVQGTATYRGSAAGNFALDSGTGGAFTATATLEVDFGGSTEPGTVEGTVDEFTVDGEMKPWSVELQAAAIIGSDGAIRAGGGSTALTYWTVDEETAANAAIWSGQFHDVNEDWVPSVATGTFEAVHGDTRRMSGAFGTNLQP